MHMHRYAQVCFKWNCGHYVAHVTTYSFKYLQPKVKISSFNSKLHRCFCVACVVLLREFVSFQVNGASIRREQQSNNKLPFDFKNFVTSKPKDGDRVGSTQIRHHTLENMCSKKLVQLFTRKTKHKVNARGVDKEDRDIQFSKYLCFKYMLLTNVLYICIY